MMFKKKKKSNKNNLFRIKVEHENTPIVDSRVNGLDAADDIFKELRRKFR